MAVIPPAITDVNGDGSTILAVWTTVTNADTCRAVSYPAHTDKSVVVTGTPNAATVAVNGSNDGTTYVTLSSAPATPIALTAAGANIIVENTVYVQPAATGGGGSQSLKISILMQRNSPLRT